MSTPGMRRSTRSTLQDYDTGRRKPSCQPVLLEKAAYKLGLYLSDSHRSLAIPSVPCLADWRLHQHLQADRHVMHQALANTQEGCIAARVRQRNTVAVAPAEYSSCGASKPRTADHTLAAKHCVALALSLAAFCYQGQGSTCLQSALELGAAGCQALHCITSTHTQLQQTWVQKAFPTAFARQRWLPALGAVSVFAPGTCLSSELPCSAGRAVTTPRARCRQPPGRKCLVAPQGLRQLTALRPDTDTLLHLGAPLATRRCTCYALAPRCAARGSAQAQSRHGNAPRRLVPLSSASYGCETPTT